MPSSQMTARSRSSRRTTSRRAAPRSIDAPPASASPINIESDTHMRSQIAAGEEQQIEGERDKGKVKPPEEER